MTNTPFHLAFPVIDLEKTRHFYVDLLGCKIGRSAERWIDFEFFGHQISAHLKPEAMIQAPTNEVDGDNVPVRHFGAILAWEDWESLATRLQTANCTFIIEPHVRFKGLAGEQGTFFLLDPSGNALEFKTFRNMEQIFARDEAPLHD